MLLRVLRVVMEVAWKRADEESAGGRVDDAHLEKKREESVNVLCFASNRKLHNGDSTLPLIASKKMPPNDLL